jgi:hypothetical protein
MTEIKKTIAVLGATGQQVSVARCVPTTRDRNTKSADSTD